MAMRAQLSLMFDDEELFENFVKPYKENKLLNSLIIRCLSAYYRNEEVRNLIEGTVYEEKEKDVTSTQQLCDNIRSSLLMQSFIANELMNTIENGIEDVSSILKHTNDFAQQSGVAKTAESEYGSSVLQLEVQKPDILEGSASPSGSIQETSPTGSVDLLVKAVLKLAEASGNNEVVGMLQSSGSTVNANPATNSEKNVSLNASSERFYTAENVVAKNDFSVEETVVNTNDFAPDSQVESPKENASNSINELLESLF